MTKALLIVAYAVLPLACQISIGENTYEEILTLEIARNSVPCVGEMTGMCIQVRTPGETEWRKFYDPIEGFRHEEGTAYVLEVGRREVEDPPADGSAFRYRLIRVIDEDPGGTSTRNDGSITSGEGRLSQRHGGTPTGCRGGSGPRHYSASGGPVGGSQGAPL